MVVGALDASDPRRHEVRVAGTAALVVAKVHKIGERAKEKPDRLVDKDAHDVYRVLVHTPTPLLASDFRSCWRTNSPVRSRPRRSRYSVSCSPPSPRCRERDGGRTEEGIGEPETVALQTAILASDLPDAIGRDTPS